MGVLAEGGQLHLLRLAVPQSGGPEWKSCSFPAWCNLLRGPPRSAGPPPSPVFGAGAGEVFNVDVLLRCPPGSRPAESARWRQSPPCGRSRRSGGRPPARRALSSPCSCRNRRQGQRRLAPGIDERHIGGPSPAPPPAEAAGSACSRESGCPRSPRAAARDTAPPSAAGWGHPGQRSRISTERHEERAVAVEHLEGGVDGGERPAVGSRSGWWPWLPNDADAPRARGGRRGLRRGAEHAQEGHRHAPGRGPPPRSSRCRRRPQSSSHPARAGRPRPGAP